MRVIGKYRGGDAWGDLPLNSRRMATDWVIKDQVFAVWVTGKPAAGEGFALDSSSQRDLESHWVAVTGTVEERKGFVYLKADKVELSPPPSDAATVAQPVLQTGARNARPDIVFTAPNEGTEELSRDQRLLIQFTKPMDAKSLVSHVQLRYDDGTPVSFPFLSVTYYADRKNSVIVDRHGLASR